MKALIIEDENHNAEIIRNHIQKFDSKITIIAHLKSNQEIMEWFKTNNQVDVVFSDIELLDGTVFSSLKENIISCPIIFTTAYNTFYQEAFDTNGIGYLLKPISYNRFAEAMQKFLNLKKQEENHVNWNALAVSLLQNQAKNYKERIVIKNNDGILILNTIEIAAILAESGKCFAIDANGREHAFKATISELVQELNPAAFFQINRGEIININFISKIENYFNDRLAIQIKNHKTRLITSTSATAEFKRWINQ
ncbi:LytR/AlgR family response regulator transcription factor [Flavobacterium soli]|uniref:LytR/AlgR family response regulator transcription factor n=1 Tax=Flavobacterium soli TaxID=344881 RepID=UPI000418E203|nr:LytTR family DNA-binding domain-containing protein [Flavobacterium soli]